MSSNQQTSHPTPDDQLDPGLIIAEFPDHGPLVPPEVHDSIRRAAWTSAKYTEDVAPHQYVVIGWNRDDLTDEEFWFFRDTIKAIGRVEEWTPPEEWVRRWGGRPMTNHYLYVGNSDGTFAYWFTWPRGRVPMLNREHISVQQTIPTRRVIDAATEARIDDHEPNAEPDHDPQLTLDLESTR